MQQLSADPRNASWAHANAKQAPKFRNREHKLLHNTQIAKRRRFAGCPLQTLKGVLDREYMLVAGSIKQPALTLFLNLLMQSFSL
eukprot:1159592-Pelagomonas_calceolata.AAC.2